MAATDLLYPFSTQDGKTIPLDIIRPDSLIVQAFTNEADSAVVGPIEGLDIAVFIASVSCMVRFGAAIPNPPVNGTAYSDMLIVPAGVIITIQCPSTSLYVRGTSEDGTLYIQMIKRWQGLGLPIQHSRKF